MRILDHDLGDLQGGHDQLPRLILNIPHSASFPVSRAGRVSFVVSVAKTFIIARFFRYIHLHFKQKTFHEGGSIHYLIQGFL